MKDIINLLKRGKTIVYPTDTAYALGGDFLNKKTRDKIYKIKKRPKNKELPVVANSLSMLKKYCRVNKIEEDIIQKYWPGPLSLILSVRSKFQKILGPTLMVRVPANKTARDLSRVLNKPLIATSANITGRASCYNVKSVLKQFRGSDLKPDIIIDGGELKKVPTSTIIKVVKGRVQTLRQGEIKVKK